MITIVIDVVVGVGIFIFGAAVGAHNVPSVTRAITALKAAEQSAQDTLARITAHKAT